MSRYGRKASLSRQARVSKKRIRDIIRLWVDDNDELSLACNNTNIEELSKYNTIEIQSIYIMRELDKCKAAGIVQDVERLKSMLVSTDREMSVLALNIVYDLREKRQKHEGKFRF